MDRYSLFLPFVQNLVVLQSCLDENNKALLVGKVLAYLAPKNDFWKTLGSDIDGYFKSEDYSALHRAVLAKIEKAIHSGLDAEEKGEDLDKTALEGIINQFNNNRQQDKAFALAAWLKTLHELRRAIRQESYRVMFNYALIQSLSSNRPVTDYKVPRGISVIDRCLKTMIDGQYKYSDRRRHYYQWPDDVNKAFNKMQAIVKTHLRERQTACLGFFKSTRATIVYNLASTIPLPPMLFDPSALNNDEPDFPTENNTSESCSLLNGNGDSN